MLAPVARRTKAPPKRGLRRCGIPLIRFLLHSGMYHEPSSVQSTDPLMFTCSAMTLRPRYLALFHVPNLPEQPMDFSEAQHVEHHSRWGHGDSISRHEWELLMSTLTDLQAAVEANTAATTAAVTALESSAGNSVSDADVESAVSTITANTASLTGATPAAPAPAEPAPADPNAPAA